ncbi:MAG: metal-dependent transcriptional regulator [Candidatus Latescibacteria bacterium]|jgi:DtxR family Mn-dependent transcriptional regulator|nr:metal-dependent transcriptional regulator [Candidatus Latescibacterota bacterium]
MLTAAAQDYLKEIYKLQKGRTPIPSVNTSMIAERMRVAAASATRMVKRLAQLELLQHTPYQGVEITPAGEAAALEVIRHHRLLELYLTQVLGYRWDEVDAEADRLEHVISEAFEDRIDRALGYPTTDPHGAPIPTKEGEIAEGNDTALTDVEEGKRVEVHQVSDRDPQALRQLDVIGLKTGVQVAVQGRLSPHGPMRIQVDGGRTHELAPEVASRVYVTSIEETP